MNSIEGTELLKRWEELNVETENELNPSEQEAHANQREAWLNS